MDRRGAYAIFLEQRYRPEYACASERCCTRRHAIARIASPTSRGFVSDSVQTRVIPTGLQHAHRTILAQLNAEQAAQTVLTAAKHWLRRRPRFPKRTWGHSRLVKRKSGPRPVVCRLVAFVRRMSIVFGRADLVRSDQAVCRELPPSKRRRASVQDSQAGRTRPSAGFDETAGHLGRGGDDELHFLEAQNVQRTTADGAAQGRYSRPVGAAVMHGHVETTRRRSQSDPRHVPTLADELTTLNPWGDVESLTHAVPTPTVTVLGNDRTREMRVGQGLW
jgi:hypothetical protein